MSIMQQSSKAQDRTLGVWFHAIQQGMVKLPRFQRFEAWDRGRIASFLNTIINNLPVGVTLALEVAGAEKFESRYIATSDPAKPGTVTQHLLDGQQRLTAFWRSMHNNYEWETFFVYLPQFDRGDSTAGAEAEIRCVPRWENKHKLRMPRWADEPAKCLERGLMPVSLLRPGDLATEIDTWLTQATKPLEPSDTDPDALAKYKAYTATRDKIKAEITTLRERVTHFNLPYLSLPADTSKDVALQVFINMNTNSKPLSLYDIIVAEVESVAATSLHELVASLNDKHPIVRRYGDVSGLVLATSALLQDQTPNIRGMVEMDKKQFLANWPKLERGLERMASFLESQRVFDDMSIAEFIRESVLRPRLKQAGALVVYDADKRYREQCFDLAADKVRVVDASESSIESREAALLALREVGQPKAPLEGVLIYVPAKRPETDEQKQADPFALYAECGAVFPQDDGDEYLSLCLRARPDHATEIRQVFATSPSGPTFAVIDAIGGGVSWPQLRATCGWSLAARFWPHCWRRVPANPKR
jgi:hypothetical protein